eukprot:CAMPEP_0119428972 /NCGR_PEP_ID=MMETSP1335-20130426/41415_1 /TAXON_ID=259385 /ORGANISM="Chrysoculter rhomboideus, Strain RCC1486" /LENGTH=79 /DNA_ID=CAMNT_0007454677 /DNA_START=223 /DNA_END=459 /DNA_ORIENTATION=-
MRLELLPSICSDYAAPHVDANMQTSNYRNEDRFLRRSRSILPDPTSSKSSKFDATFPPSRRVRTFSATMTTASAPIIAR